MTTPDASTHRQVGPVLSPGHVAEAVLAAIRELNPEAEVINRGAYLRISVPHRCRVTRAAVEKHLRAAFRLPADLEEVMVSFQGDLLVTAEEAVWS
jgi:toluene monooxygenase system protein D